MKVQKRVCFYLTHFSVTAVIYCILSYKTSKKYSFILCTKSVARFCRDIAEIMLLSLNLTLLAE